MKNMKIEINAEQPLDEVVKELKRLGFKHSGWYGVKSNSPILVVEVGRDGNYEYYNHLFFYLQVHPHPTTTARNEMIIDTYAEIEQVRQDNVNHPSHYASGGIVWIDAIESSMTPEAFKGYLKGNLQKYMWRYEHKGGKESLEKAQ